MKLRNIDPDKPLTKEELDNGLDINNMPSEDKKETKEEKVNPALDSIKTSIDKVGDTLPDTKEKDG